VLLLAAVGLIALLLVGPRLVDAYANWLWFGEVGFRSVWVTVLNVADRSTASWL
jgi:uncharacterized membrane protein (UPF0182 family)